MNVLLAVLAVGGGSLIFRLAPLLGARRLPDGLTRVAAWAGLSVLTAITVRAIAAYRDPAVPAAPLVAALCVGVGLYLAFRGRSLLLAAAAGAGCYLALSAVLSAALSTLS
jgi:branched-subunit amino acid transport protein